LAHHPNEGTLIHNHVETAEEWEWRKYADSAIALQQPELFSRVCMWFLFPFLLRMTKDKGGDGDRDLKLPWYRKDSLIRA
jgi:hypothetical protein